MSGPLEGKAAIVTGSARNIGRAIALALAADGARILVHAQTDRAAAEAVADEIRDAGGRAEVLLADVRDPAQCARLVEHAVECFGRLDIVVSNAAVRRQHPFAEIDDAEWRDVLGVALDGAFYLVRAAAPHLRAAGGGSIVCIGGSPSHMGVRERAHVAAAKMGVVGLCRVLATELGPDGVNVNVVAPGHVDTARGASAGRQSAVTSTRPIERRAAPGEIAAMVRHLCRPEGAYVTGQVIHVNGGMYLAGA